MAWSTVVQSHLNARKGYMPRWMLYVRALETDRTSAPLGIWSGEDDLQVSLEGIDRLYRSGADGMIPDEIVYEKGTNIRNYRVNLNGLNETALELVMGRIIRGRDAELHLAFMDPLSGLMIGAPERMVKGSVNRAPVNIGPMNGASTIQVEIVSSMRMLTKPLGLKKSDQSQKLRGGDRFYKYGSVSNNVKTEWMRKE
jgi:hypothetical protein